MKEHSYFEQQNSFYIRRTLGEFSSLHSSDIALYASLLALSNMESAKKYKKFCVEFFFPVSQSDLMKVSGLSNHTFYESRDRLKEAGLISYKSGTTFGKGNGKTVSEYSITYLCKITLDNTNKSKNHLVQNYTSVLMQNYTSKTDLTNAILHTTKYINKNNIFLDTEEKKKYFNSLSDEDKEIVFPWLLHLQKKFKSVYYEKFTGDIENILSGKQQYGSIRIRRIVDEACKHSSWKEIDIETINSNLSKQEPVQMQPMQIKDGKYKVKKVQEEIK